MKQKTNPNNSDMLESFYQRARQGETEQKFMVEINGQQVPTMQYINQMFFCREQTSPHGKYLGENRFGNFSYMDRIIHHSIFDQFRSMTLSTSFP